jgi:hypothetical protein
MDHGVTPLAGGNMADTFLLTYADGTKLVQKSGSRIDPRRSTDAEELGALVAQMMGVRAPAMVRSGNSVTMEFIGGRAGSSLTASQAARLAETAEGRLVGLMDAIVGATDRARNWISTGGRGVAAIDFGVAFGRRAGFRFGPENPFTRYLTEPGPGGSLRLRETIDVPASEIRALRERLQALEPEFARLGRADWHAAMMQNVAELERRALPGTARAAVKKAAAPKAPPVPERMSAPALRTELQPIVDAAPAAARLDLAGVPKPTLAAWAQRARDLPPADLAEEVGRWRLAVVDRRRAVAEALAEADELLDNGASAAALGQRARARLRRIEELIRGWPDEAPIRALVTAMSAGNQAAIRRAIAAARRKLGLRQVGTDAGSIARFDRTTMSPIAGAKIADGASVRVVRPGYEVDVGGQRIVLSRPVVEEVPGRDIGMPSQDAPTLREILDQRTRIDPGDQQALAALEQSVADAVDGTYGQFRVVATRARVGALGNEIHFSGAILDAKGNPIGQFTRVVIRQPDGTLVARHSTLTLSRKVQGSGLAQQLNANLIDWYRRSGVTEIRLMANIDVGGYAWATKGFDFLNAAAAREFVDEAIDKVDKALATFASRGRLPRGITEADLRSLERYLADIRVGRITAHARDISVFGRQPGQGGKTAVWPGKWLMLGSGWRAVLRL